VQEFAQRQKRSERQDRRLHQSHIRGPTLGHPCRKKQGATVRPFNREVFAPRVREPPGYPDPFAGQRMVEISYDSFAALYLGSMSWLRAAWARVG
jgi:hypothetical protein